MFLSAVLLAAFLAADPPTLAVSTNTSKHEVTVVAGPFDAPAMAPHGDGRGTTMMDHGEAHDTPLQRFTMPVDGWLRGFRVRVLKADGTLAPRRILHHMILVNFDRRQLVYSAAERMMGVGAETADTRLPATIGLPIRKGMQLGLYAGWHNETGADLEGLRMELTLEYMPTSQNPRPRDAMPIYMDVNLVPGKSNTFDIPAGKSTKSHEFTVPVSGRLLAVGGHLHDYGVSVRVEEAATGKLIAKVDAQRDRDGRVSSVSRSLFGVTGEGKRMKAGTVYRVVGEYDNPTGQPILRGAMANMVGLFAPDDAKQWPAIDPRHEDWVRDVAVLEAQGQGSEHEHGGHDGHGDHDGDAQASAAKDPHAGHAGHGKP